MECKCVVPCSKSEFSFDRSEKSEEISAECNTFDFGSVRLGENVKKVFVIKNDTNDELVYMVTRDPDSNEIYQAYDFHYQRTVPKNSLFKCIIWYKPNTENWYNFDSLYIQDHNGKHYKLILKGFCVGASVHMSSNELKFVINNSEPVLTKTIELQNKGTIPAKFKFDVKHQTLGCFKIDITHGVIEVRQQIYVKITFEPKEYGEYLYDLYLLVLYSKPRRISLIGYYTKEPVENEEDLVFKMYYLPVSCKTGFSGYLNDVVDICEMPPLFSLTDTSLDFGGMEINTQNPSSVRTLVTSLTNNINYNSITVYWDDDPRKIFDINPHLVTIPPNNSVLLECSFKPDVPDRFYDHIMTGRVFWSYEQDDKHDVIVPVCIYLRVMGSSFPINKCWIPQTSYPKKVTIKPTYPNSLSYGTFKIKIMGNLPVSYRFVPPKNSRYTLKPSQGVILNEDIITIQFSSVDLYDKECVERWSIILNGRDDQCNFIIFSCYAEYPKLLLNKDNTIVFENILPGCYDVKPVVIKNISTHYTMYRLKIPNVNFLRFNKTEGILIANEETTLECKGSCLPSGACHSEFIMELSRYGVSGKPDAPVQIPVRVTIKCIYAELCAIPSVIDLGTVRVGQKMTSEFDIFNFGEAKIHSLLVVYPDESERLGKYITFTPKLNEVAPGEHKNVVSTITCNESGEFAFNICYKVRIHENSMEMLELKPKLLIKIVVSAEYPSLQIVSISDYTHGECFSKTMLWKMLNITKFNKDVKELKMGETQSIEMCLPDCEVSDEPFSVTLIIQNTTLFDLKVDFKRNQLCDCPIVKVDKSFSLRKTVYNCPHRLLLEAKLSGNVFQTDDTQTLKITVHYNYADNVTMSYILSLSEERTLIIYFSFKILPLDIDKPSKYDNGNIILLPPVALNEKEPACFAFQFYNQSSNTVTVGLDESHLDQSLYDRGLPIIRCLNAEVATLNPNKLYCLFFQFHPIAFKKYNILIKLLMGHKEELEHKLTIQSSGSNQIESNPSTHEICASKSIFFEPDISFTTDYIKVNRLLTWSCTEILLFMKNNTDDVIGYSMKRNWIEGMMEVRALAPKGILNSNEVTTIVIYVETYDMPLKTTMNFIGKFLNHTKYFRHKKTMIQYNIKEEIVKEQFTITEKGEEYAENDIVIAPLPKNFYRTISLGLSSVSIFDIDLHMDAEEQLQQSPHDFLEINEERAVASLYSNEKQLPPVPALAKAPLQQIDGKGDSATVSSQNKEDSEPFLDIDFFKDIMECLIFTAMESKIFKRSLETQQYSDPPFYIQFQVDDDVHFSQVDSTKVATVKKGLNPCQGPIVATTLRNVLLNGLHQNMNLGTPPGQRKEKGYVYDKRFKNQFTK
nr:uncharacterized protein LOC111427540 [Onthophagus taurus]